MGRPYHSKVAFKDGITAFKSWAEKVAQQRLESDQKLQLLSQEAIYKELMQEMDRSASKQNSFPLQLIVVQDLQLWNEQLGMCKCFRTKPSPQVFVNLYKTFFLRVKGR